MLGTCRLQKTPGSQPFCSCCSHVTALIARFMGPTWGPSGADRTQVGPILAPWILLSGDCSIKYGYSLHGPVVLWLISRRNSVQSLAKPPLNFNGGLVKLGLNFFSKIGHRWPDIVYMQPYCPASVVEPYGMPRSELSFSTSQRRETSHAIHGPDPFLSIQLDPAVLRQNAVKKWYPP